MTGLFTESLMLTFRGLSTFGLPSVLLVYFYSSYDSLVRLAISATIFSSCFVDFSETLLADSNIVM